MSRATQERPLVVLADSVFDGEKLSEGPTEILVVDGLIAEIAPRVSRPDGFEEIDLTGRTVAPGLIDAHVHTELTFPRFLNTYRDDSSALKALHAVPNLAYMVQSGFTTVRDLGAIDDGWSTVALKRAVDLGLIEGPRMIVAPHIMSGTGGHAEAPLLDPSFHHASPGVVNGAEDIRRVVRNEIQHGADWIKVSITGFFGLRPGDGPDDLSWTQNEMNACVEAASDYGVDVSVHALSDAGVLRAIKAGARSIEHASLISDETLALAEEQGVFIVPTMRTISEAFSGEMGVAPGDDGHGHGKSSFFGRETELVAAQKRIAASGVKLAYGSDCGGAPPLESQREFRAMSGYGVEPLRALRAATSVAAELLRRDDLGSLSVGKRADIVAFDGNPLADISAAQNVVFVATDGVVRRNDPAKH